MRIPPEVPEFDDRFAGPPRKALKARRKAENIADIRTGYFCDCSGCGGHVAGDTPDWLANPQAKDMAQCLQVCCKQLPCGPLARDTMDGHFTVDYPFLKAACLHEAWEAGLVDMTWKCWACFARSLGSDYTHVSGVFHATHYTETFIARRIEMSKRTDASRSKHAKVAVADDYSLQNVEVFRARRLWSVFSDERTRNPPSMEQPPPDSSDDGDTDGGDSADGFQPPWPYNQAEFMAALGPAVPLKHEGSSYGASSSSGPIKNEDSSGGASSSLHRPLDKPD